MSIKLEGSSRVKKRLNNLNKNVKNIIRPLEIIGFNIEREAKILCPVDTTRLRSSIRTRPISKDTVIVGTPVFYAEYPEFGTSKQKAQPYFRPAIQKVKPEIPKIMSKHLENI